MSLICKGKQIGKSSNISGMLFILRRLEEIDNLKEGDLVFFGNELGQIDTFYIAHKCIERKVAGIIRLGGGLNDHGSIVAKETGVNYLKIEKNLLEFENKIISVCDDSVFQGDKVLENTSKKPEDYSFPDCSIKVKLNLSFIESLKESPNIIDHTDGVGFSRYEFVLVQILEGYHPTEYIKKFSEQRLVDKIKDLIEPVIKELNSQNKEFWIRSDDFTSNDLFSMIGGSDYEDTELVTSSGFRGIRRSITNPEIVSPQFEAIGQLLNSGYSNIRIFPPMTNSIEEFLKWKSIGKSHGIGDSSFGLMVETPRSAFMIDEFLDEINFVVFGTNDLTQFLLATDRNNSRLSNIFNENDNFVKKTICDVISKCKVKGIETYIGGNAATNLDFIKDLIKVGLSGVSVIPDKSIISKIKCEFKY